MAQIDGLALITTLVSYIKDQQQNITHDERGLGHMEAYNNVLDFCRITLERAENTCKYCESYPCRCEEIDARRKYGNRNRWNSNGY